ncbi:phosphatidylinositol-glycan biosynthesis class F protein [Palaemon carinicauda]|uniref:phosphatidylinositol-glycan biosynthesis class F protein n=1 Tax=Palaemon carinicauda TaxID=392227 RepID=UPI0035B5C570
MISSRGVLLWNLPRYSKFIISFILDLSILCYLVYSNYRLEDCLPAIRLYSLSLVAVEFLLKLCPRNSSPDSNTSALGRTKTRNKSSKVADAFLIVVLSLCSICGIHIVTVLYGAYLIENVEETLTFSILLASLALIRPLVTLGPKAFQILLERLNWEEELDLQCIAVFLGAWLGALPIPLDWDTPWQVWPLTCCIGAILGELITSVYLLSGLFVSESGRRKNKAT